MAAVKGIDPWITCAWAWTAGAVLHLSTARLGYSRVSGAKAKEFVFESKQIVERTVQKYVSTRIVVEKSKKQVVLQEIL